MPDPLNLVPHAVAQEHDPTFMGTVARPAPRMPDQDLNVKLSWNPLTSIRVPAGSWAPIHGPVMPREGDSAVVHVDDQRFVRCVWWGPSAVAAPASDSTARAYVTFAAQTATGLNLVPLDTLHADNGQNLNLVKSQYVVPHDGIYRVSGHVQLAVPSAGALESYLSVFKNGEERSHGEHKTAFGPTAGGDLAGSYPNPTVVQIQTRPVSASAPSSNQGLVWDGSSWSPATVLQAANNLSDVASVATARSNMHFGSPARACRSAAFNTTGNTEVLVPLDTVSFDADGRFSQTYGGTTHADYAFVANAAGVYSVMARAFTATLIDDVLVSVRKNGAIYEYGQESAAKAASNSSIFCDYISMNSGDYLQLYLFTSLTIALTTATGQLAYLSAARLA